MLFTIVKHFMREIVKVYFGLLKKSGEIVDALKSKGCSFCEHMF